MLQAETSFSMPVLEAPEAWRARAAAPGTSQPAPVASSSAGALAACVLEQFDHGALLLEPPGRLVHANRVALRECARHPVLQLSEGRLLARSADCAESLHRALRAANQGRRTLLHFAGHGPCLPIVVTPLAGSLSWAGGLWTGLVMVLLAKRSGTEALNIDLYAQAHGLTPAEQMVLKGLSCGSDPADLARAHGVSVCTIRTQILCIRQKTGTASIRQLLDVLNNLPPVVCAHESRA